MRRENDWKSISKMQVACGEHHVIALTRSGEVSTWGLHSSGQLGHGSDLGSEMLNGCLCTPKKLDALAGHFIRQVSPAHFFLCQMSPSRVANSPYHPYPCPHTPILVRDMWTGLMLVSTPVLASLLPLQAPVDALSRAV